MEKFGDPPVRCKSLFVPPSYVPSNSLLHPPGPSFLSKNTRVPANPCTYKDLIPRPPIPRGSTGHNPWIAHLCYLYLDITYTSELPMPLCLYIMYISIPPISLDLYITYTSYIHTIDAYIPPILLYYRYLCPPIATVALSIFIIFTSVPPVPIIFLYLLMPV
jgi:hypothetical protein